MNNNERQIIIGPYACSGMHAACIVAVVTSRPDGRTIDWAAYIGGASGLINRELAADYVAETGDKLHASIAQALFPDLPFGLYRS